NAFNCILVFSVCLPEAVADTCAACKTAYGRAKTDAASDKTVECVEIGKYLHCLEGSWKGEAGCPLPKADSDAIEADYAAATCNGIAAFTDTCVCQKNFWATDVETYGAPAVCSAITAYIACLKGKTAAACDGSTTVVTLATGAETRITNLGSSCAVTSACQCEIDAAKADISSDATMCTAYKAELSCLRTAQSTACDGTRTKSAIATASEAARAALPAGDCPALSSTCQCEVNAAKGAAATSATYCTVLTTLKTCLSAITTTTEEGCTATTQAGILTDTNTKITAATCGAVADHATFATTSLIVSVLVNMFL
ncbi:mucin-21-like, partial [Haliotis cracherodii]|uniref:mucin-21-like n=1 Tax=Haliotis cracherodii TaxID=6455 RepID=UPI0039ECEDCC